jgi:hypothetical protein
MINPEKKAKLANLRTQLANMSPEQKQKLIARGLIATVEGRVLSAHNTIMCYLQSPKVTPTIVGGYNQWKAAGKHVGKGEHGMTILFPARKQGELEEGEKQVFFTGTVFDVSQVEDNLKVEEK